MTVKEPAAIEVERSDCLGISEQSIAEVGAGRGREALCCGSRCRSGCHLILS